MLLTDKEEQIFYGMGQGGDRFDIYMALLF
jgi:hypothetical protein